jgi:dipeptidyl aminopeptidase/acylaminoacyl peptidase
LVKSFGVIVKYSLLIASLLLVLANVGANANTDPKLIPYQAWIHDPFIDDVGISPDGNKLAALTLSNVNEPPDITVWDMNDLSKPPIRFRPPSHKAIDIDWLDNENLLVVGRQIFDYRYGGKPTRWFRDTILFTRANGKGKFRQFKYKADPGRDYVSMSVRSQMLHDPKKILVEVINQEYAAEFYEVDIDSLISKRVFRGGAGKSFSSNREGEIFLRSELKNSGPNVNMSMQLKNKNGGWEEHFKLYAKERSGVGAVFKVAGGTYYVLDNSGREFAVLKHYDPESRTLSEPVFEVEGKEVVGVLTGFIPKHYNKLIGYLVDGPSREYVYTDPLYKELQDKVNAALPGGQSHRLKSMSNDMSIIVIESSGPKEAGQYHLLVGGSDLIPLGRAYPHLKAEDMAEMKFVTYKARDGLDIPGFLTIPKSGAAPYPTVILPHGGPWARDYLGWDSWAQFLANRGYLVLQPQYRGSEGWGQTLWRAGDNEWGQKMQDDKDDGAMWLVEQGLADKDRLAMYGYSYGGYASMAAVVRENSPYQCAIAGAGLSELDTFDKITFESEFNREYQNPTISGLSPLYNVEKANIPIFIFHGDRDQRVPVNQSRKYAKALEKAGKPVKYLEIPDLWHSLPWWPQHHLAVFQGLEEYLANECGPGGL